MPAIDRIPGMPTRVRRAFDDVGSDFVPYTGAVANTDLGAFNLATTGLIAGGTLAITGLADVGTFIINTTTGGAITDIDPDTTLAADLDTLLVTQKAIKAYVDGGAGGIFVPYTGATGAVDLGVHALDCGPVTVTWTDSLTGGVSTFGLRTYATQDADLSSQTTWIFGIHNTTTATGEQTSGGEKTGYGIFGVSESDAVLTGPNAILKQYGTLGGCVFTGSSADDSNEILQVGLYGNVQSDLGTAATNTTNKYGLEILVSGTADFAAGIHITTVIGADANWAIYNASGADCYLGSGDVTLGGTLTANSLTTGLYTSLMGAENTTAIAVDGTTYPYTGDGTTVLVDIARTWGANTFTSADSHTGSSMTMTFDGAMALDTPITQAIKGSYLLIDNDSTWTSDGDGTTAVTLTASEIFIDDNSTWDAGGKAAAATYIGQKIKIDDDSAHGNGAIDIDVIAFDVDLDVTPSGTVNSMDATGLRINIVGNTTGSTHGYGIHIESITGCDYNYAIWNQSNAPSDFGSGTITTTGALGCGAITVTVNSDITLSGTGHIESGSEGFIVGSTILTETALTDGIRTLDIGADPWDFDMSIRIVGGMATTTGDIDAGGNLSTEGHLTIGDVSATDPYISFAGETNEGRITFDQSDDIFNFGDANITTTTTVTVGTLTDGTLTITGGNISGADVDITAGTGDYSSSGTGRFDGGIGVGTVPSFPIHVQMAATDSKALHIDGTTNDYTGTGGDIAYCMYFGRDFNAGDGNEPTNVQGFSMAVNPKHTSGVIDNGNKSLRGVSVAMADTGKWDVTGGSNRQVSQSGIYAHIDNDAGFECAGGGKITFVAKGIESIVHLNPTFDSAAPTNILRAYGTFIDVNTIPTLSSGALTVESYGLWLDVDGTATGSSTAYGIYIAGTSGADVNYAIYDNSGADWSMTGTLVAGSITAGASTFGDGGTTNYLGISATGDAVFHGSGGLVFGNCYGNHIGWSQVNAAQNTWYNISDADILDGVLHDVTHDGSGKLTVTEPGMYLVSYSCCFEDNVANDHVEVGIEVTGSGSANAAGQGHLENKFVNEEEHLSSSCILDLADNTTLEVAIRTTDAGTPTISVQAINLTCVQVGGT